MPLAYGAQLAYDAVSSPGDSWVERRGKTLLGLAMSGFGGEYLISNDRDIVSSRTYADKAGGGGTNVALDLRTGATRSLPAPCDVADRHGPSWYLICRRPLTGDPDGLGGGNVPTGASIEVMHGSTRPRAVIGEPAARAANGGASGYWAMAFVSPDGGSIVAQWSGGCATSVYFAPITTGALTPLGTLLGAPADLAAQVAGWTLGGQAVVLVPFHPACGEAGRAGVYLAKPGKPPKRIYAIADGQDVSAIAMWQPLLK